ncbi:unnamed protein product [Oikopleura dioica]|uniref:Uncharacterized protein n=1 Tax=Oikopleura dioica TaxID=34765 RepID=E4YWF1_OIKDI|nr:unnamed protein product [Oikopleura dioica]
MPNRVRNNENTMPSMTTGTASAVAEATTMQTIAPRRALQELSRNHQATTSYAAVVRQAQTTNNPTPQPLLNPLPQRPSTLQVEQMIARAQQEALQQRQVQRVLFQNQARALNHHHHRQQQQPNNHRSSSSNRHQPTPFEVENDEEEGSGSDILVDLVEIPPAQPREPTQSELSLAERVVGRERSTISSRSSSPPPPPLEPTRPTRVVNPQFQPISAAPAINNSPLNLIRTDYNFENPVQQPQQPMMESVARHSRQNVPHYYPYPSRPAVETAAAAAATRSHQINNNHHQGWRNIQQLSADPQLIYAAPQQPTPPQAQQAHHHHSTNSYPQLRATARPFYPTMQRQRQQLVLAQHYAQPGTAAAAQVNPTFPNYFYQIQQQQQQPPPIQAQPMYLMLVPIETGNQLLQQAGVTTPQPTAATTTTPTFQPNCQN